MNVAPWKETAMNTSELTRISNHPKFKELARKRSIFAWSLAAAMLVIYMGFIFLVAFGHSFVAQVIGQGPMTMAFPLGLGVIVAAVALTGVYVIRANTEFDRLTREILGEPVTVGPIYGARLAGGVR